MTRRTLTEIADQFQYWAKNRSEKWGAPMLEPPALAPFRGDRMLAGEKRCQLDRLYQRVSDSLDTLLRAVGLDIAA